MRVRSSRIKGDPHRAKLLEEALHAMPGVTGASASTVTGTVLVRYCVQQTSGQRILELLDPAGFEIPAAAPRLSESLAVSRTTHLTTVVGRRVFDTLIEKIIEHSAVALVAALI